MLVTGWSDEVVARASQAGGGEVRVLPGAGAVLLEGPRESIDRTLPRLGPEGVAAALCLARRLSVPGPLALGPRTLTFGADVALMGIVNVTPDSFSDGGDYLGHAQAIAHGLTLVGAGAQVLDVGGESTRPGAEPVSAEEELRRVLPVIAGLARAAPAVPLSVDTSKAEVARACLAAGATLVNDVSGLGDDAMAGVVAQAGAALCVMHMQGAPRTMQAAPRYDDVVAEVAEGLARAVERAVAGGVPRERIVVDPGFGFGKTLGHNCFLHRHLADFRALGLPLLVGTSRKSMLGGVLGGRLARERVVASAASAAIAAVLGGADLVRVHDVAEARDALAVAKAVRLAHDGGARWSSGG